MKMQLLSVNVGQPRQVVWKGRTVTTAIFKEPVAGRIPLRQHNLKGDAQADLSIHGGPYKAVYLYRKYSRFPALASCRKIATLGLA